MPRIQIYAQNRNICPEYKHMPRILIYALSTNICLEYKYMPRIFNFSYLKCLEKGYLAYLLLGTDHFEEDEQFFNLLWVKIRLELLEALVERRGKRERA